MSLNNAPDLTKRPPRSPRVKLGGYVHLPRMLDKGRATIAGKQGEYHYNCPMDQHIVGFLGLDPEALKTELATGKGDGEILEWIGKHARHQRTDAEIANWSAYVSGRAPADPESREFFNNLQKSCAPKREDIVTWFDLLDADDFVTFGGTA